MDDQRVHHLYHTIYTISIDTKVLSKVLELLIFPVLLEFAEAHYYTLVLATVQNQYPDVTFISKADPEMIIALDIKTTYRTQPDSEGKMRVNGMTLGTFGGYFRNRDGSGGSVFPYNRYKAHYVLGAVYSRVANIDERATYNIADLQNVPSVVRDFEFFVQEKYRIASDRPGSGNTRNIGSTPFLERLLNGTGIFSQLGVDVFDDYWMNYYTQGMAREAGLSRSPYRNLPEYRAYKAQGAAILQISPDAIETEAELETSSDEDE